MEIQEIKQRLTMAQVLVEKSVILTTLRRFL